MASLSALLFCLMVIGSGAVKLEDSAQGVEFTKCITITDFQTKTLADDITLSERLSNGCCPAGTVPGAQFYSSYKSPQIVCGFKTDGTLKFSMTTGTNAACTYNKCYIDKQNLACADGTKQLLNGCCAATTKANTGFEATCKNYFYSKSNVHGENYKYCTTYHKDYSTIGYAGTSSKTDDQVVDGSTSTLAQDKIYTYATCSGGSGGSGGSSTDTSGVDRAGKSVIVFFAAWIVVELMRM